MAATYQPLIPILPPDPALVKIAGSCFCPFPATKAPRPLYFTITTEVQILLAVGLFYLYDAALALQPEQGLLRKTRTQWLARLASSGFELRRCWLLWPPLLMVHQPLYLLRWDAADIQLPTAQNKPQVPVPSSIQSLATHAQSFKGFAVPLYLLAAMLFGALPLALFLLRSEVALLVLLALIYLTTLWISLLTWRHGQKGLSEHRLARSTALQILLCPPFALNAVRKLSIGYHPVAPNDLLFTACSLMDSPCWNHFSDEVQTAMAQEMQEIAELPEYALRHGQMLQGLEMLKTRQSASRV